MQHRQTHARTHKCTHTIRYVSLDIPCMVMWYLHVCVYVFKILYFTAEGCLYLNNPFDISVILCEEIGKNWTTNNWKWEGFFLHLYIQLLSIRQRFSHAKLTFLFPDKIFLELLSHSFQSKNSYYLAEICVCVCVREGGGEKAKFTDLGDEESTSKNSFK